jgi:hypothetical protein
VIAATAMMISVERWCRDPTGVVLHAAPFCSEYGYLFVRRCKHFNYLVAEWFCENYVD